MYNLSDYQRDILIRTILGEADGESELGQAAVAYNILNRSRDPRWPDDPAAVALQPQQYSTWNKGAGGNSVKDLPSSHPSYQRARKVLDRVASGELSDPTGGATHYYSPVGMDALVRQGVQKNRVPKWWDEEVARRGGNVVNIGGHKFAGLADGSQPIAWNSGEKMLKQASADPASSLQHQQPPQNGVERFFGGSGGDIVQALGLSMMSHKNPLQAFPQIYPGIQKSGEDSRAMAEALIAAGIEPKQAASLARNPTAAKLALDAQAAKQRLLQEQQQRARDSEFLRGFGQQPQAASETGPQIAGDPMAATDMAAAQIGTPTAASAGVPAQGGKDATNALAPASAEAPKNRTAQYLDKLMQERDTLVKSRGVGVDAMMDMGISDEARQAAKARIAEIDKLIADIDKKYDRLAPKPINHEMVDIDRMEEEGIITPERAEIMRSNVLYGRGNGVSTTITDENGNVIETRVGGRNEGGLGRTAINELEKLTINATKMLDSVKVIGDNYEPEFLEFHGKGITALHDFLDRLPGEPPPEIKERIDKVTKFTTRVERVFNEYRREITGAAASVQELERLYKALMNTNMSPSAFESAYKDFERAARIGLKAKQKLLNAGLDPRSDEFVLALDRMFAEEYYASDPSEPGRHPNLQHGRQDTTVAPSAPTVPDDGWATIGGARVRPK